MSEQKQNRREWWLDGFGVFDENRIPVNAGQRVHVREVLPGDENPTYNGKTAEEWYGRFGEEVVSHQCTLRQIRQIEEACDAITCRQQRIDQIACALFTIGVSTHNETTQYPMTPKEAYDMAEELEAERDRRLRLAQSAKDDSVSVG